MKPSTIGTDKKRKSSPPSRSERLAPSTEAPLTEPVSAPVETSVPEENVSSQQFGRLKDLLRQLEQQVSGVCDESSVDLVGEEAGDGSNKIAADILEALARRVQQDDRLLAQFRDSSAEEEVESAPSIGQRVSIPAGIIPLASGGQPDLTNSFEATIVAIDPTVVSLKTQALRLKPGMRFVAGVEGVAGTSRYATLEFIKSWSIEGGYMLAARPADATYDLFRPENLMPSLDRQRFRYETRLSPKALARWAELGVLRPRLLDRIMVCPRCVGLPTVRSACEHCGCVEFNSERLMHHFACACVGSIDEFDQHGELVCPKCRMRHLVAGTDFEYLDGPYQCQQCSASESDLALSCQCMQCDHRFPLTDAMEQDLVGYDVDRLDILALVDDA